ncbi:MAG: GSCFA domain protein [Flavobacteriaceae bacterium]|nr:MAG: GSCFA domain protein [Flavobacteriaceae bacterium]
MGSVEHQIDHHKSIFTLGSCFAEHMADRMKYFLFDIYSNPNGIIYNPISLANVLENVISDYRYQQHDLIKNEDVWYSWNHHHLIYHQSEGELLNQLNNKKASARKHLAKSHFLMITFGSAFAYQYNLSENIVANCHKIPGTSFTKIRLGIEEIVKRWQSLISDLTERNPKLQIIFTVSPVRHIKDGLIENQKSKSILLLATDQLVQKFECVHYFPAYEIMMDDLRDYRFYASDMIHPSQDAVDYIWNRFIDTYASDSCKSLMLEIDKLQRATAHRLHNPNSNTSFRFRKKTEDGWKALYQKYPFLAQG